MFPATRCIRARSAEKLGAEDGETALKRPRGPAEESGKSDKQRKARKEEVLKKGGHGVHLTATLVGSRDHFD